MKKSTKILGIMILLIIATVSVYIFLKGKQLVMASTFFEGESLSIKISENKMKNNYNNIYSVSHNQKLMLQDTEGKYEATASAEIRGENVTFKNYTTSEETTIAGKTCIENNIMAAIISGAGVENTGYKYIKDGEYYSSGSQLAIWEFWNTWVENSGAKENGFEKGIGNGTITENGLNGEVERKKAQEQAKQNTYDVNIYFLKYLTDNNTNIPDIENQPNLILIEMVTEKPIEPEYKFEKNSDISIETTSNYTDPIKVGKEIIYTIKIYNQSKEEKENFILKSQLPEGVTFVKAVEVVEHYEVELIENMEYTYNKLTRILKINTNKIDGMTEGTITNDTTGETTNYTRKGTKTYQITVTADELEEETYSKEIKNSIQVEKEYTIFAQEEIINTISDVYLEIEAEKLPETMREEEECVIGLKIINKGLINAENVNVKINIPEEILTNLYRISFLSETGEIERTLEGTLSAVFENNTIGVLANKTVYIQMFGKINETEVTKQVTIEGTVNEEKVYWTTTVHY